MGSDGGRTNAATTTYWGGGGQPKDKNVNVNSVIKREMKVLILKT